MSACANRSRAVVYRHLGHDARGRGLVEDGEELVGRAPTQPLQRVEAELPAKDRGQREDSMHSGGTCRRRRPMTSRTPRGTVKCHEAWTGRSMRPSAARSLTTSPTKSGLPSVSRTIASTTEGGGSRSAVDPDV